MIRIIAALTKDRVLGKDGKIPWDLAEDRAFFARTTKGHVLIMGRLTYESIGHALLGRRTIVVSRTRTSFPDCSCASSLDDALKLADGEEVYLCGGAGIYEEGLALAEELLLTWVDLDVEGDTWFPTFEEDLYDQKVEVTAQGAIPYRIVRYRRKEKCGESESASV